MTDPRCYATDGDVGPINWRCNRPVGHETPHGFDYLNVAHHEWVDE